MRPLDDTGAAKRQESGLPLMDIPSPGSRQEPAAAEVVETPRPGGCWQCPSSPCGSRAQQEAEKKAPCPGLGLFYTLLSAFLFSVGSLFVKKVQDIHAVEISAFRCVFQMLIIIPCLIYRKYEKMNCSGLHPSGCEAAQVLNKAQRKVTNITSKLCNQTGYSL
uniref:Solute carrier family 35 member G1 n=1 Tax=Moschus moschiferus TaxID=68415 RepID=A0A8C6FK50_MOSMO